MIRMAASNTISKNNKIDCLQKTHSFNKCLLSMYYIYGDIAMYKSPWYFWNLDSLERVKQ